MSGKFFATAAALLLLLSMMTTSAEAVSESETLMGWHDFHMTVTDEATSALIKDFVKEKDCLLARESHLSYPEDVLVPQQHVAEFTQLLKENSVKFDVPDTDIGSLLLKEKMENARRARSPRADPSTYFAKTDEIYSWMRSLAASDSDVEVTKYGSSYENRDLLVLKLSTDKSQNKPIVFVDSTIHAREWLATATLCYIIKEMIANKQDPMVQKYDWYFVPVVNPDGYDYTHRSSSTRFWRKTRQPYGTYYYGADPNRNFDMEFGGPGTSNNPASDTYHGPHAFSEPETKALSDYLRTIQARLANGMYVSFHTYGQLWLTPPAYSRVLPPDHAEMVRVATAGNNALRAVNGRSFKNGQPANVALYEAAGGSYDWVKYRLDVKYSFTLELFPSWPAGIGGFVASVTEIPKSGAEILAALKAAADALP